MREFEFINSIKAVLPEPFNPVIKSIGDDCAIIPFTKTKDMLITSDMSVEGTHFSRKYFKPFEIGARSMAVNISDICAMGGYPRYAIVSIGFPSSIKKTYIDLIYRGISNYAENYSTDIIGGDTVLSPEISISITLIGDVEKGRALRRDTAKPGDAIFVTGTLGDSYAGLKVLSNKRTKVLKAHEYMTVRRHLMPVPAFIEGRTLLKSNLVNACMDISDGLVSDIKRISEQSGTGAEIWADKLPVSFSTGKTAAQFKDNVTDYALYGGEDYVLLFTSPEKNFDKLMNCAQKNGIKIFRVGRITKKNSLKLFYNDKIIREDAGKIWNHF
jgi:thiamine-monophosphate kinase